MPPVEDPITTKEEEDDDVQIIAADTSLLRKFGKENLDRVMSSSALVKAEKIIEQATDDFYNSCLKETTELSLLVNCLKKEKKDHNPILKNIISTAFAIKTKSGQAGYDLVSTLAKSLHIFCEENLEKQLTSANFKIIDWYESGIKQILSTRIKGDGGEIGKAIMGEIDKLKIKK